MKKVAYAAKKLAIPLCLLACAAVFTWGVASLSGSIGEIRAGYADLQGETAGLFQLSISGKVLDLGTKFSYTFRLGESQGDQGSVAMNPWDESMLTPPEYPPFVEETGVTLRAVSGVREEQITSESGEGGLYSQGQNEKRVYADVFEVIPISPYGDIPVHLDHGGGKLYLRGSPGTYISYYWFAHQNTNDFLYSNSSLESKTRHAYLPSRIEHGGVIYFVPAMKGLYGQTYVYSTPLVYGDVDLGEGKEFLAREVYPIALAQGEDEVCGFIRQGDVLLIAVRRGDFIELTRLLPEPQDGVYPSVSIPASLDLEKPLANESLMLFSAVSSGGEVSYRLLDTSAMVIAASGEKTPLQTGFDAYTSLHTLRAFCFEKDVLYLAYEAMVPRVQRYEYRYCLFAAAYDKTGGWLGSAQVLTGLEDDPNMPYDPQNNYFQSARQLKEITLMAGGSHD